jgi:hypothetical protein
MTYKTPLRNKILTPVVNLAILVGMIMNDVLGIVISMWWFENVVIPLDNLLVDMWKKYGQKK